MARELKADDIIQKYTKGSSAVSEFYTPKNKERTGGQTEISIDNYYNFYGVMSPEVTVKFLNPNGGWTDINKKDNGINQNNFFVSASIEDSGFRRLSLTLFDRTFYSLQELIYGAIKAGGGRNLTSSDSDQKAASQDVNKLKIESEGGDELTTLDFVYQPDNRMKNNLRIVWGYSEENTGRAQTNGLYSNYFKKLGINEFDKEGNEKINARWNERTDSSSQVKTTDKKSEITQGSYSQILGAYYQPTIRSQQEEFFITNVSTTLTNTGMQYHITAVGTDSFILNGYKFVQMYANLQGTAKEMLALFMRTFNENPDSFLRVIWTDTIPPQNGNEYAKNFNGEYVLNDEKHKDDTLSKIQDELEKLTEAKRIYKNSMAAIRRDDSNDIDSGIADRNSNYEEIMNKAGAGGWNPNEVIKLSRPKNCFSCLVPFLEANSHDAGGKAVSEVKTVFSLNDEKLLKTIGLTNKFWSIISISGNADSGVDRSKEAMAYQLMALEMLFIKNKYCEVNGSVEAQLGKMSTENITEAIAEVNDIIGTIKLIDNSLGKDTGYKEYYGSICDQLKTKNDDINSKFGGENGFKKYDSGKIISNLKSTIEGEEKHASGVSLRNDLQYIAASDSGRINIASKIYNVLTNMGTTNTIKNVDVLIDDLSNYLTDSKDALSFYQLESARMNSSKTFFVNLLNFAEGDGSAIFANGKFGSMVGKKVWKYDSGKFEIVESGGETLAATYNEAIKNSTNNSAAIVAGASINLCGEELSKILPTEKTFDKSRKSVDKLRASANDIVKNLENLKKKKESEANKESKFIVGKIQELVIDKLGSASLNDSDWKKYSSVKATKSGKTYRPTDFWQKIFDFVISTKSTSNFLASVKNFESEYNDLMLSLEGDIVYLQAEVNKMKENDNRLITISLGGEEAKNNYSAEADLNGVSPIYYKSVSSLFSSYASQCPPYKEIKLGKRDKSFKAINENGEEVVSTIENESSSRNMTWSVIGFDKSGIKPVVGFRYSKPFKSPVIRVYEWGNGNASQHCIKNLSIQNTSEFGMLNMALSIGNDGTSTKVVGDGTVAQSDKFFSGRGTFANCVTTTKQEKDSIVSKMVDGIKKGTIEVLGDPSLRFQDEFAPYSYPIKLNIKLQKDSDWSSSSGYIPCQLSGYYVVTKITHNLSASGYTTTLEVMSYPGLADQV